jgi:O-antigen/teichoic acid export membrane protein
LPTLGIEGILSTYKKTIFIAVYNTLSRILMLIFIVAPVIILKGTYLYAIYGWIMVSLISFIVAYCFKGIPFRGIAPQKARLKYKDVFSYSLPLVVASIAGVAIRAADQFYISRFFGAEVFAEFSNGFIELPFVGMITVATSTVLMPVFSKLIYDKSSPNEIITIWRNALIKSATVIYPVVIFFSFNAENTIIFLYSSAYKNSVIYFQISMILNFFNIIIFAPLLFALGKTKLYARLHMLLALFAWLFGYLVVVLFHSPVAIAVFSVCLNILKIIIFLQYVVNILDVRLLDLVPLKKISSMFAHCFIIAGCVKILTCYFFSLSSTLISLLVNLLGFFIIIMLTAKIFNLNYLFVLRPILNKYIRS